MISDSVCCCLVAGRCSDQCAQHGHPAEGTGGGEGQDGETSPDPAEIPRGRRGR